MCKRAGRSGRGRGGGAAKKNGVLRDRETAGYKARNREEERLERKERQSTTRATTFGRFEDNLHYSRGKFLPWRVNGSLGPEIRIPFSFSFLRPLFLSLSAGIRAEKK